MIRYAPEFLAIAVAHLLAVASPGPDFALIVRQSVSYGRTTATWAALGIGAGILLHATYSVLGLGLVVRNSPAAFTVMKFAGAAYLAWLGVQALRTRPRAPADPLDAASAALATLPTPRAAFTAGLLTNALNAKALLFFVSLFTVIVSAETPRLVQAGYGVWMAVATAAWFAVVARFFAAARVRAAFLRFGHWFDRAMGAVLLALAVRLAIGGIG